MPGPPRLRRRDGYTTANNSNITSLQLRPEERALLREVADAEGVAMSEVLRRGLRLYAAARSRGADLEPAGVGTAA